MAWLRKHPIFALVLLVSAAAVTWEGWQLYGAWQRTTRAEAVLRQRKEERDWLAHRTPALSAENSEAIAADVAAAGRRLEELRRALQGRGRWLPAAPHRPIDAYFALATFTKKTRALARRQQVELRADERFGFASYASIGPAADQLAAVHRQQVLVEHLVEALLEAQPRALLAVQRERPRSATAVLRADRAGAAELRAGEVAADFFELDAQVRLRGPGLADTEAFRVEFTGQTQSLRALITSLAVFQLPLVVRAVEVEPLAPEVTSTGVGAAAGAPVPLVTQNFSKFSVVVEFIEPSSGPNPTPAT